MEEEDEAENNISNSNQQLLKDWEHIHLPLPLTLPKPQTPTHLIHHHNHHDFSIFPPSNHEGLPIPIPVSISNQPNHHFHEQQDGPPQRPESRSPPPSDLLLPPPCHPSTRDSVIKQLTIGFHLLYSKFARVAFSVRSWTGENLSFRHTAAGLAAALLVSWWFLMWQRWRRSRTSIRDKMDGLIFLIRNQDEKINQLSDQIAQLKELLSSTHRVPIFKNA